jgi:hypothetical protein
MLLSIHRSSEAEGDQTERLASPSQRRRSTSGGDKAAAMGTSFSAWHLFYKAGWFGIILLNTGEADYAPCLTC